MDKKETYKAGQKAIWTVFFIMLTFITFAITSYTLIHGLWIGARLEEIELGKNGREVEATFYSVVARYIDNSPDDHGARMFRGYYLTYRYVDENGEEYDDVYDISFRDRKSAEEWVGEKLIITIDSKGHHSPNTKAVLQELTLTPILVRFSIWAALFLTIGAAYYYGLFRLIMRRKASRLPHAAGEILSVSRFFPYRLKVRYEDYGKTRIHWSDRRYTKYEVEKLKEFDVIELLVYRRHVFVEQDIPKKIKAEKTDNK